MEVNSRRETLNRRALLQRGLAITAAQTLPATKDANLDLLATLKQGHPRLIASAGSWNALSARRKTDTLLTDFLRRGEGDARALLKTAPVVRKMDGKRLLATSRAVLRRVLLLALHARLTGDAAFVRRAEQEMLAVAAFSDWNPSHFLDTAEMTAALALGYDWLYDLLSDPTRKTIAQAIVEKGLRPGLANEAGASRSNNWNSVCLCGLSLGALAVADLEPTLANQVLAKAKANNFRGLKPYAPDGVYPEGAMYWGYGTTFQVVLLDTLQTALGTDWGLGKSPGFLKSGDAQNQQFGPTGKCFNFSDNEEWPGGEPAMWWYARTLQRPDLLTQEISRLKEYARNTRPPQPLTEDDRLLPLAALWWPPAFGSKKAAASARHWRGQGVQQIASFRDAWNDPQAMWLAVKAGGAPLSHAHMDAGSFVFEAGGVRWASDLGKQEYLSLESRGIDLWNGRQNSNRWGVFRLGPFSHNTLTINGERHRADGLASLTHFGNRSAVGAIIDLSPVFKTQASRVTRGFAYRSGSHALIRDEIEGLTPGDKIRWAMLTRTNITLSSARPSEAILSQDGQKLRAVLRAPQETRWEIVDAEKPGAIDAPNPGARLLIAMLTAPASGRLDISVFLQPLSAPSVPLPDDPLQNTRLSDWPQPPVAARA